MDHLREKYEMQIQRDLRNPAAALMCSTERLRSLLSKEGLEPEARRAESILKSVRLLNRLIRELA